MFKKQKTDYTDADGQPIKYFQDQFDDEEVLYVFRHHPVVMREGLVFGMLGPLAGVIPAAVKPDLGFGFFFGGLAAGFILGALIMLPGWISWHFSVFIMTDQRFIQIKQKRLFNRSVADIGLSQIQSINYEVKGIQETLLGFGTIKMQTYVGDLVIHEVHHPPQTQKTLATILRDQGYGGAVQQGRPVNLPKAILYMKKPTKLPKLKKPSLKAVRPSLRRTTKAEKKVDDALSNVPRITNDTVADHREEVLKSARKYIYPLQHSKHRVVRISITLFILVVIGFFCVLRR